MKRKEKSIHELIKERFGTNIEPDERFTTKTYADWIEDSKPDDPATPESKEPPEANPDRLAEAEGIQYKREPASGEVKRKAKEVINLLTPREKEVLQLISEGFSLEETASLLKVSVGTIKQLLNRARTRIK